MNNFFTEDIVSANSTLLLPLQIQKDNQTLGVLVLGQKKSELDYMFEEKNFLKNFVASISMALNNLMLKEETVSLTGKNIELENKALFLKQITANLSHDLKFTLNSAYSVIRNLKYTLNSKNLLKKGLVIYQNP